MGKLKISELNELMKNVYQKAFGLEKLIDESRKQGFILKDDHIYLIELTCTRYICFIYQGEIIRMENIYDNLLLESNNKMA